MSIRYIGLERRDGRLVLYRSVTDKEGNGVIGLIAMPAETLSIRAGEYGLDPEEDKEAVIDIILHEMMVEGEDIPLMTAATLEEARETQLGRCREKRDKFHARKRNTSREEDETHVEVLDALAETLVVDHQLALLVRDRMKEQFEQTQLIQARQTFSVKAKMIDAIREKEGV